MTVKPGGIIAADLTMSALSAEDSIIHGESFRLKVLLATYSRIFKFAFKYSARCLTLRLFQNRPRFHTENRDAKKA